MPWAEAAALAVLLALEIVALAVVKRLRRQHAALESTISHAAARAREQALRLAALEELNADRELAAQVIGSSSSIAHNVQRGFSELPTPILGNLPEASRVARELHQNISRDLGSVLAAFGKKLAARRARNASQPPDSENPRRD